MMKMLCVAALAILALALSGCEGCNGGITGSSKVISHDILRTVNAICGTDRDGVRGGVDNIMLMDGREDDGIVTCHDGTNHYFDA